MHLLKAICSAVVCLLLLSVCALLSFFWLPSSINYHIVERYQFKAGDAATQVYLGMLLPQSGPYQKVDGLQVAWDGIQWNECCTCVDVQKLSGALEAGEIREAVIEYDLRVRHGVAIWSDDVDDCYLQPEALIESDDPQIAAQAGEIVDGVTIQDAFALYTFTGRHLHTPEVRARCSEPGVSAGVAFRTHTGVCGEYARLMTALCRAVGIPARSISGILMPDFEGIKGEISLVGAHPGEAHAWTEFHTAAGWSLADPIWGSEFWPWLYFGRNDGRRVRYGGAEMEARFYRELKDWTREHGRIVDEKFAGLKYVVAVDGGDVRVKTQVTVQKIWDGRWLAAVLGLGVVTAILYGLNKCVFVKFL